jgi:hypothetical protein
MGRPILDSGMNFCNAALPGQYSVNEFLARRKPAELFTHFYLDEMAAFSSKSFTVKSKPLLILLQKTIITKL